MKNAIFLLLLVGGCGAVAGGGCSQTAEAQRADLYNCEGCEAINEHSFEQLGWSTTIPDAEEPGEPLILTGTVYEFDGKTPAEGVIVYAYHTNAEGIYPKRGDEEGWARRHGYLRGWTKTGADGRYRFRTIKPGSYPSRNAAAHIHMTVKEPDKPEYWIDEVVFASDPLVTDAYRRQRRNRGGSGIVSLTRTEDGAWRAVRDIVLEQHPD